MAGIGFELQKLFEEDSFSGRLKAYGVAGFVTAGPWLLVILSIAAIQRVMGFVSDISQDEQQLFVLTITYSFIFSQVLFGSQQLVVTRYAADLIYAENVRNVFASFIGFSKVTTVLAFLMWVVFSALSPLPLPYKAAALMLFIVINLIWVLFVFLSAAERYGIIAFSFLAGGGVAVLAIYEVSWHGTKWAWGPHAEACLLVVGFTAGLVVTLFMLFYVFLLTFPERSAEPQFAYFSYFDRYPSLFWIGLFYNAGIWVCDWVAWFAKGARVLDSSFLYNPVYDTAVFWSYLTIVPTLVLFVVAVETRFYKRYRNFYGYVNNGGTLTQIRKAAHQMQAVLKQEVEKLARAQGIVTVVVILAAAYIFGWLSIGDKVVSVFRMTALGAFSNAMLLVVNLLLLYFDDRKDVVKGTVLFFTLNLVFSLVAVPFGFQAYGLGFAVGSTVAFFYTGRKLIGYMEDIEFQVFCTPYDTPDDVQLTFFTRLGRWLDDHRWL